MARKVRHVGFDRAASSVQAGYARRGHPISAKRARAIVASSARKSSPAAKRRNPRLRRVRGA